MTPEELIKLCDAAEYTAPCDCNLNSDAADFVHIPGCASWQATVARVDARDTLFELDFGSPARARSYAKLWAALDDAKCVSGLIDGRFVTRESNADFYCGMQEENPEKWCVRCKALATGGT